MAEEVSFDQLRRYIAKGRAKKRRAERGIMSYEKARKAFETMEQYAELSDQVELDARRLELMRTPTPAKARDMYVQAIRSWHWQHRDKYSHDPIIRAALMTLGLG